jgi:exosortase
MPANGWTGGRVLLGAMLLAFGIFAARGAWDDIINIASRDEESSHLWLVPFLALWLLWLRRTQLLAVPPASGVLGPVLVAVGWAVSHWGFYGAKQSPWHFGAVLVVVGCLATAFGTRALLRVWPAVLVLAFLVPVPGMVRQTLSIPMERYTAQITAAILKLCGFPIDRSGNQILVNNVPVTVAEACNGLRLIFALFLIVYVFCFMMPLRGWVRWLLLLTSPVCLIVCNVLRLLPTVLLYGYATQRTAKIFHDVSGWIMLLVAFMLLMGVVNLMRLFRLPVMNKTAS